MAQEFFINDQQLEDKIRQLLPSQGGLGAGFDLSASTQIIPIVDLTESASGSNLREDLQTSMSLDSITSFNISNTTTTIANTTGYFRIFGTVVTGSNDPARFSLTDGVTTKIISDFGYAAGSGNLIVPVDFVVFLAASQSVTATSGSSNQIISGNSRQIATINGELVNPN